MGRSFFSGIVSNNPVKVLSYIVHNWMEIHVQTRLPYLREEERVLFFRDREKVNKNELLKDIFAVYYFGKQLPCIDLSGMELYGTCFAEADLVGVDLRNADLSYADLPGISVSSVELLRAKLESVNVDGKTYTRKEYFEKLAPFSNNE